MCLCVQWWINPLDKVMKPNKQETVETGPAVELTQTPWLVSKPEIWQFLRGRDEHCGIRGWGDNKEDELAASRGLPPLPTWLLVALYPESSIFVSYHPGSHYTSWDATGAIRESSLPSFWSPLFLTIPSSLNTLGGSSDLFRVSFLLCDYWGEGRSFLKEASKPP